jgi:hypothetical protein
VLAGVPLRDAGSASGVLSTSQQVGAAVGIAAIGAIFFGLVADHGFSYATAQTLRWEAGAFLVACLLTFQLPRGVRA